jgi:hypothetical protein
MHNVAYWLVQFLTVTGQLSQEYLAWTHLNCRLIRCLNNKAAIATYCRHDNGEGYWTEMLPLTTRGQCRWSRLHQK